MIFISARLAPLLIAACFVAIGIFVPTFMFAGALRFMRGHLYEVQIGRVIAFTLAAIILLSAFYHQS